ncbi:MAG: DNA-binding response regulator [Candidatus Binatia bacterium]|nr:MAG: DNA-binding response regulator [Candidatus Binatia bacterium]
MIRAVVVDDEKLARDRLVGFLREAGDVAIEGEARNGPEALRLIEEKDPDLVLLDVQMPGMNGFEVLRRLQKRPHVVFATAYDEYALRAFEVEAVDYLLKPVSRDRLLEALRRVRARLESHAPPPDFAALVRRFEASRPRYLERIPVHRGRQILLLPVETVFWFAVEFRLVYAHTATDRYMTNFTLRELEEKLDPDVFFRAHKSRLVNLEQVRAIRRSLGRYRLVMKDEKATELELSRTQARVLRARLGW